MYKNWSIDRCSYKNIQNIVLQKEKNTVGIKLAIPKLAQEFSYLLLKSQMDTVTDF